MCDNDLKSHKGNLSNVSPTLLQRCLLFILVCFLIAYRQPAILNEPRFWAEEGKYFFSYAFSHDWFDTVFYVVPHLGYYSLAQNLAALFATSIPLEQAPIVTTYLGLFSHLLPCCIVIAGNSLFWDTLPKKALICLGILFFPFGRIWLNTTYVHFTLALIVFFILLEKTDQHNRLTRNFFRSLIVIGGLSGAVSCFLTPVFVLKAWRSRLKEDTVQASLLVLVSVVQVVIIIYTLSKIDPTAQSRFVSFGFEQFWSIISLQFGLPFFGPCYFDSTIIKMLDYRSYRIAFPLGSSYLGNAAILFKDPVTLLSVLLVMAYVCYVFIAQVRDKLLQIPAISFLLVFVLSSAASLHMRGGSRYAYVPCVIMLVMFVTEFYNQNIGVLRKSIAAFYILLMLMVNGYGYRKGTEIYPHKWSDEIRKWQIYHNYKPKIWPYGWEMTLDPVNIN